MNINGLGNPLPLPQKSKNVSPVHAKVDSTQPAQTNPDGPQNAVSVRDRASQQQNYVRLDDNQNKGITAYKDVANNAKREEIEALFGVDLYA